MTQQKNKTLRRSPSKTGLNPIIKALLWIVGIFGVLLFVGLLIEDPYPKSRDEMVLFVTNKCWKYEEIEINSIEIDGKAISKPSSDVRNTIRKLATDSNDELIWQNLEDSMARLVSDNLAFLFFRQLSNKGFTYYSQSTDNDLQRPTYEYGDISIEDIDGKYQFDLNQISQNFTFDDEQVESGIVSKFHQAKIVGLSKDMLRIEDTFKGTVDGTPFSFTTTTKYKVVSESILDTKNLKRVIENSVL